MRALFIFVSLLLIVGCGPLRPDQHHILILRSKQSGGDYLVQPPGPFSPKVITTIAEDSVIYHRPTAEQIEAFLRAKFPTSLSESERHFKVEQGTVIKIGDAYFWWLGVEYWETNHSDSCQNTAYGFLITADGVPVEISRPQVMETCPA